MSKPDLNDLISTVLELKDDLLWTGRVEAAKLAQALLEKLDEEIDPTP